MILRSAKIQNFRQLRGENRLTFAQPGEHNVTLILGENGSGKTTLLNAFTWCLYGEVNLEKPDEILSHASILDANAEDDLAVSVELVFESRGRTYTLKRKRRFQKEAGGTVELRGEEEFEAYVRGQDGETRREEDPVTLIERILPRELSKFFFFRGEDAEALAGKGAQEKLKTGVEAFLELKLLDRAIKHLRDVEKEFERELKGASSGDLRAVTELIETLQADRDDILVRIEEAEQRIRDTKDLQEDIEQELTQHDEIRPKLEEKARLVQKRHDRVQQRRGARGELAKSISRDGFLAFAKDVLAVPLALAEEAAERGEIPARIKPQFVSDLLDRGTCICGTTIDDDAATALEDWKKGSGLAYLEEGILQLRGDVRSLQGREEAFQQEFHRRREALAAIDADLEKLDGQISRLEAEIGGRDFGLDEITALQRKRGELENRLNEESVALGRAKEALEQKEEKIAEYERERRHLAQQHQEQAIIIKRIEAVQHVSGALSEIRENWSHVVRDFIDGELKESWRRIAQLERLISFTDDFKLSMKERTGDGEWIESAPSSANKRALALAFIASLIELTGSLAAEGDGTGGLFRGDQFPIVMDAPFATMDTFFKSRVPDGLKRVVPQLVLISSYDQWEGEVSEVLAPALGRSYVLELHRPETHGEDLNITLNGQRVSYVVGEAHAATDWTKVEEVSQDG